MFTGHVHDRPSKVVIKDLEVQNEKTFIEWKKEIEIMQ